MIPVPIKVALVVVGALICGACGPSATGNGNDNNNSNGNEGDAAISCQAWETDCNGVCVDTNTDSDHCGGCDHPCTGIEFCNGAGVCTDTCVGTLTNCSGLCVDTQVDVTNCGYCGHLCLAEEICRAGNCEDENCGTTSSEAYSAMLPADIILVVDNSDSMTDEAAEVQNAMNDFVAAIVGSGIDARVVLISADNTDSQGICVPAPVGSGSCPSDTNPPGFVHIYQDVGSSNGLERILTTYSQWSQYLRPNGTRTIGIITDDNSGISAASFTSQMVALDASFTGFKFDAIIPPYDIDHTECVQCMLPPPIGAGECTAQAGCDRCCGPDPFLGFACTAYPDGDGQVYRDLVNQTGGVEGDLCTQDFLPVFQDMATAVVDGAYVACLYDIPEPPGGGTIDFDEVNVQWVSTPGATPELIPNVPGGATDCGSNGGWYYDDPSSPTQLLLCPATCTTVEASSDGRIDVTFGCATVVQ